jgi:hypothetical protein
MKIHNTIILVDYKDVPKYISFFKRMKIESQWNDENQKAIFNRALNEGLDVQFYIEENNQVGWDNYDMNIPNRYKDYERINIKDLIKKCRKLKIERVLKNEVYE